MQPTSAALLLLLATMSASYEEKDFGCRQSGIRIPSTSVCDGVAHCASASDNGSDSDLSDESQEVCAPAPYLDNEISLVAIEVTNRSILLSWSKATTQVSNYSLELAGYFVTGKSEPHSFQNTASRRLVSYQVQWLKPWTSYKLILRPFYTETGKPQALYKIGRAASVDVQTLSSAPEVPGLATVLSPKQRNVVLNIVGPSAWNSDALVFHVRWEPTVERRGLRGELDVALPADWSAEENALNATLPLQGGWDYTLFVSALGADASGAVLRGPELEVEVSVPLDSYEILAYAVDPTTAVLSWRASEPASIFRVTVDRDMVSILDRLARFGREQQALRREGEAAFQPYATLEFDGTKMVSSRHITEPWGYYVASLEGCLEGACSDAVNTSFVTPPNRLPQPLLTIAGPTDWHSFELAWEFPQDDRRVYDGFRVRYCTEDDSRCSVAHTQKNSLSVQGVAAGTTFSIEVRALFRTTDGTLELGPAATESVSTWTYRPALKIRHAANINDGLGTCLLAWNCYNSDISYLQYSLGSHGHWTTCNDSAHCDVTVKRGGTVAFASGYLRLTHHGSFRVDVRGCNIHGCGEADTVEVNTHLAGSVSLVAFSAVSVTPNGFGAQLRWETPDDAYYGIEITWDCGDKNTYYKQIPSQHHNYHNSNVQIQGLPSRAEDCTFYIAKCKNNENGRTYCSLRFQASTE